MSHQPPSASQPQQEEIHFHEDVPGFFQSLVRAVEEAKDSIRLCYFTVQDGEVAQGLVRALEEQARAGVKVNLLVDSVGMMADEFRHGWLSHTLLFRLRKAGVEVRVMRVLRRRWPMPVMPFGRLHTKMAVFDKQLLMTGGTNIGDWYLETVDTNVSVKGPLAEQYAAYFDHLFDWCLSPDAVSQLNLAKPSLGGRLARRFGRTSLKRRWTSSFKADPGQASLLVTFPGHRRDIRRALMWDVMTAKERIELRTWIFVPDPMLLWVLGQKAKAGVDVEIIRSEKCKVFLANLAAGFCEAWVIRRGARVYRYTAKPFHPKTWVCDGAMAAGNANIDWMSFSTNHESMLRLVHPTGVAWLRKEFEKDKKLSQEGKGRLSAVEWVKYGLAYLFFWLL